MTPRHVYVHVPFCARRCSYCDFSIAVRRVVPVERYIDGVMRELAHRLPPGASWTVDTLYLGGGTPSLLGADGVARLLGALGQRFVLAAGAEVTLEANPDDVTAAAVRVWRAAGVNRLSLGSQSFDDRVLAWMHRTHESGRIAAAVGAARCGGIENVSLDLIFALPAALARDWDRDLEMALALRPEHLSLYGLTIEPATPLGRWHARGAVAAAREERYAAEFLRAHAALTSAGYEHYEVSNVARAGRRSLHNSSYWRRVPYLGLGPSAHSFDGARRRWNVTAYAAWLAETAAGRDPVGGTEVLSEDDVQAERIYLGLRTAHGVAMDPALEDRVGPWVEAGWAMTDGGRLRLTPSGWLRLDSLAADLTLASSR